MTGHTSWEQLRNEPYKRWYRFGRRSPGILYRRFRNKHMPIHRLRMAYQRARYGYCDSMFFSLNYTLAELTIVGCRTMRENGYAYPGDFAEGPHGDGTGWASWEAILLKIEEGFQIWIDEGGYFHNKPEQEAKFDEAMKLYAHWFGALWD